MRSSGEESLTFTQRARRAQLIESAVDVLADGGYQTASLSTIAARAGVSKGVVSYHFSGKDDLLEHVVREIFGSAGAVIASKVALASDPATQLHAYIESNLDYLGQHPRRIRALMEIVSNARGEDGSLRYASPQSDPLVEYVAHMLKTGQETGDFGSFDTTAMAVLIRGAIDTASARLLSDPAFDLSAYAREVLRVVTVAVAR